MNAVCHCFTVFCFLGGRVFLLPLAILPICTYRYLVSRDRSITISRSVTLGTGVVDWHGLG